MCVFLPKSHEVDSSMRSEVLTQSELTPDFVWGPYRQNRSCTFTLLFSVLFVILSGCFLLFACAFLHTGTSFAFGPGIDRKLCSGCHYSAQNHNNSNWSIDPQEWREMTSRNCLLATETKTSGFRWDRPHYQDKIKHTLRAANNHAGLDFPSEYLLTLVDQTTESFAVLTSLLPNRASRCSSRSLETTAEELPTLPPSLEHHSSHAWDDSV